MICMSLKKKVVSIASAGVIALSFAGAAVPVFAATTATISSKQAAIDSAAKVVPAEAVLTSAKTDDDKFDLEYLVPDTLQRYEIEVDRATSKVKEVEIKSSNFPGSVTVSKTAEDVKAAILEAYPDAKNIVVTLKDDSSSGTDFKVYEAKFETPAFTGEAKLNPATALIGEQELEYK